LLVLVIYFVYRLQKARAKVIQAENKRIEQELEFKKREKVEAEIRNNFPILLCVPWTTANNPSAYCTK